VEKHLAIAEFVVGVDQAKMVRNALLEKSQNNF
jgi:hypothetical protein